MKEKDCFKEFFSRWKLQVALKNMVIFIFFSSQKLNNCAILELRRDKNIPAKYHSKIFTCRVQVQSPACLTLTSHCITAPYSSFLVKLYVLQLDTQVHVCFLVPCLLSIDTSCLLIQRLEIFNATALPVCTKISEHIFALSSEDTLHLCQA